ncbi:MAG TPA: hypothetical protein VE732_07265, partial [Nitrososphaera sp.]|nr:hypothetical protein [Nitrososphaera sp.]
RLLQSVGRGIRRAGSNYFLHALRAEPQISNSAWRLYCPKQDRHHHVDDIVLDDRLVIPAEVHIL